MKKHKLFIIIIAIILIILLIPIQVLIVEDEYQEKSMYVIHKGNEFSLRWIHSVEKEEWEEFFVIKDGEIYLDATRFKTFGAGVPNQVGNATYLKDGWVYMVDIDRHIDELFIRAGSDTNHRLIIHQQAIILSKPNQELAYHLTAKKELIMIYLLTQWGEDIERGKKDT